MKPLLIIGQVIVDFTLTPPERENKLRLGGIAHAARGLWALQVPFAVAAICPAYLRESAKTYLQRFGCVEFVELGEVLGAPNVMVIGDPTEVGDQGYEDLLRDDKTVRLTDMRPIVCEFDDALVFPGDFSLVDVCSMLPTGCRVHIDVAYGVRDADALAALRRPIDTILISTSSDLFRRVCLANTTELWTAFKAVKPTSIVLKENRGGARVMIAAEHRIEPIPALLGSTLNSVGVGDVFSAVYVALKEKEGPVPAAWKAARASSAYAQTTNPDLFEQYVQRGLKLALAQMKDLGGVSLPWEHRKELSIYLAAPDFSHGNRTAINDVIKSLEYHNFWVRRPIKEIGELPPGSGLGQLTETFNKDVALLGESALVFAVPTERDPGTLVEIGIAIERRIPVVVYDPHDECRNTMVVAGAKCYSQSLDECLNAVFEELSVAPGE
jgi:nucleoside 2-deoxyribosyltransferase